MILKKQPKQKLIETTNEKKVVKPKVTKMITSVK